MPPPQQQPINISFDNMFGGMMDSMMPREYGFRSQSYVVELDEDIMDALPPSEKINILKRKCFHRFSKK